MDDGWFCDEDGSWYFLSQEHDGYFGHMLVGWFQMGGIWYYARTVHDGTYGSLWSGWLWDKGHWYWLHPLHDGNFGAMLVGWQRIEGAWYYLYPQVGAPQGSCALDTVTPDGYRVDASGRWVA